MTEWQGRVIEEKAELDEKLGKLVAFLAGEVHVSFEETARLSEQEKVMRRYSEILGERIACFQKAAGAGQGERLDASA